jgi:pentalenene oxygenase
MGTRKAASWKSKDFPLLGNLLPILRDPLDFLERQQQLGEAVAKFRVGTKDVFLINDPGVVHEVLVSSPSNFHKGSLYDKARVFLGDGLATSEGTKHRKQRKVVHAAFGKARLLEYAQMMADSTSTVISSWTDGERVPITDHLHSVALDITTKSLFSAQVDASSAVAISRCLPLVMRGVNIRFLDPTGLHARIPTPGNRRFGAALRQINQTIDTIIAERIADGGTGEDLLSMILASPDPLTGAPIGARQLRDEVMTFFAAGTETTAHAISWACHLMSTHPHIQEELWEDLGRTLPFETGWLERVNSSRLLRNILLESLRLYPPAAFFTRSPRKDMFLGGRPIPAGAILLISPYAMHRNPLHFPNPECFDPARWSEMGGDQTNAFIPFGAGLRRCIGERFSWLEMSIVMAYITTSWKLQKPPDGKVRPKLQGTLTPHNLTLIVQSRKSCNTRVVPSTATMERPEVPGLNSKPVQ